jgi:AP2 domain/HNH endonuclease
MTDAPVMQKRKYKKTIRPIRIEGDIAYVTLTKGYETVIDSADVNLVCMSNWCASITPRSIYAVRTVRYGEKTKMFYLHRDILLAPKGMEVDHINCNSLYNRRSNLRVATTAQNRHNQRIRPLNTSGFKGVSFAAKRGKWRAGICVNNKSITIGYFETKESAHSAYVSAAKKHFGEFARAK